MNTQSNYALYPVTTKCAIFNQSHDKVLLAEYHEAGYGLPGGHIELGETPEQAIERELLEEVGDLKVTNLQKRDFWFHPGGKLVLAFTATADETFPLKASDEHSNITWVDVHKVQAGEVSAGTYDQFILSTI